jgi:hypothetical protein
LEVAVPRLLVALAFVLAASPAPALASDASGQIVVGLAVVGSHTEGAVVATTDAVATGTGRAEILFADGTLLHIDAESSVRWAAAGPLALDNGRVLLRTGTAGWLDVVLPFARATLAPGGTYGLLIDASHARLLLSVTAGGADLRTSAAQATLGPSDMVVITESTERIVVTTFEPAPWDTFLLWSRARQSGRILAAAQAAEWQVPGSTVISLGPGGFREFRSSDAAAAPSYSGGESIWYGGVVGWPVWGYGGGYDRWDKRRDPYAPHYEPYRGSRGARGEGRGGPGRTGPATQPPMPPELPPAIPARPPARGGVGKLPSPRVPPGPG